MPNTDSLTEQTNDIAIITPQLSVVESQERANIDMLIATAKKYPRDIVRVKRNMEAMATLDEDTAESCNYHLERNGKAIDGPSVRMAEIAVAAYQNIRCGSRVLSNDGKVITGQAFCHDLENNTFIAWETQRRITDKSGRTYGEDMQVVTGNAASAIAFRNAVFKVIPGALIKPVAEKARAVAVGDLRTLSERRTRALKKFAAIGVNESRILSFLGRTSIELVDIADIEKLFGIFTAIKEGSTTIEEQFPVLPVKPNFEKPEAPNVPPASSEPAQPTTGEMPKRGPGRPRKNPVVPDANLQSISADSPKPAEPETLAEPKPEPAPETPAKAPSGSLFPEEAQTTVSPAQEISRRLKEAKLSEASFLELMREYGFADCDQGDITMGDFTIHKMDEADLKLAILNWPQIIQNLTGQQK